MRHLTPLLAVAIFLGMFGGVVIEAPITLAAAVIMSASWALSLLAIQRRCRELLVTTSCVLVLAVGWLLGAHAVERALNPPLRAVLEQRFGGFAFDSTPRRPDEPITIEGRLLADAQPSDAGATLRLAVVRVWVNGFAEDVSGGVSVNVSGALHAGALEQWRAGRVVRAPALLRRPARYLNEGVPDQERALARRGISLVGSIKSARLVEVIAEGRWWEEAAAAVRARTRTALTRHVGSYSQESAAIATAILIGDRAGLSDEAERRLQEAGTYHVIAISGGNIAILAAMLVGGAALVGVHGRSAAVLVIFALAAYGIIAAGGASVLRATVMAIVYFAVRLIDQRTAPGHAIALTASSILIINPLQVVDVGFLFTFGATMALVSAAASLQQATPSKAGDRTRLLSVVRRSVWMVMAGTICVELALAPITAFVFQRVTVAGLVLNFAALPAMTVVQLTAMGVVAADLLALSELAHWLSAATHSGARVLTGSAGLLDLAPWLTWRVPSPAAPVLATYYCALAAGIVLWFGFPSIPAALMPSNPGWRTRLGRAQPGMVLFLSGCAAALFLWIVVAPAARVRALGDGQLHVTMFDVGQGDSVLVTFPDGRRLLVDAGGLSGGAFDVGDRVVGPALRAQNLLRLDYLAVTHGDFDHAGGAISLLRDFAPREVWWGVAVANHAPTVAIRREAQRGRAAWRTVQRDDTIEIGTVLVRVLHPPLPEWERQRIRNNDSIVMELRFGRVSVLLTGDIGRETEQELAGALDPLPVVILKVPHHGSLTSSSHDFLRAARPSIALVGVGRGNMYGHPSPYIVGRLHDAGANVFRTDLDGQITVTTDGEVVKVRTFTRRRAISGGADRGVVVLQ